MTRTAAGAAASALLLAGLGACKDATLGPELRGDIEGQVLHFETGEPVVGASITTTPPSEAILTSGDGVFRINELEEGTYQITARKFGYGATSVSVSVRDDRIARAAILLDQEEEEPDTVQPAADLRIDVVDFWHDASVDSTWVETEYRVQNVGGMAIDSYEIYFRIETDGTSFFHEEVEENGVGIGEANVRRFRVELPPGVTATDVVIDGLWTDPPLDGSEPPEQSGSS